MACVGLGREGGGLLGLGFVFMVWRAWLWAGGHVGWVADAKLIFSVCLPQFSLIFL